MGTRQGKVKKTDIRAFRHPRAGGIIAQAVGADDAVIAVVATDGWSASEGRLAFPKCLARGAARLNRLTQRWK